MMLGDRRRGTAGEGNLGIGVGLIDAGEGLIGGADGDLGGGVGMVGEGVAGLIDAEADMGEIDGNGETGLDALHFTIIAEELIPVMQKDAVLETFIVCASKLRVMCHVIECCT